MGSTGKSVVKEDLSSYKSNSLLSQLTYNTDYRQWTLENRNNPDLRAYIKENGVGELRDIWRQQLEEEAKKDLHEMPIEDAIDLMQENIRPSALSGWFREGNSDYKPEIVDSVLTNKGVLNAALNIAYHNYLTGLGHRNIVTGKFELYDENKKPLSFDKWLVTPQEMYRGVRGQKTIASDIFSSFTPDKRVAAKFTISNTGQAIVDKDLTDIDQSKIITMKIRPIDTYGSYRTNGELEYLIPSRKLKKK